jgi:hypothetical protein
MERMQDLFNLPMEDLWICTLLEINEFDASNIFIDEQWLAKWRGYNNKCNLHKTFWFIVLLV